MPFASLRLALCAGLFMSSTSCSQGTSRGSLVPAEAPGVEVVTRERKHAYVQPTVTARIRSGQIVAEIGGRWTGEGSQDLDLHVVNGGAEAVRIAGAGLKLSHKGEQARLLQVFDVTGVDVADDRTDNDVTTTLYDGEASAASSTFELVVPARGRREFLVSFGNFLRPDNHVAEGGDVIAEVALPGSPSARVRFVAD